MRKISDKSKHKLQAIGIFFAQILIVCVIMMCLAASNLSGPLWRPGITATRWDIRDIGNGSVITDRRDGGNNDGRYFFGQDFVSIQMTDPNSGDLRLTLNWGSDLYTWSFHSNDLSWAVGSSDGPNFLEWDVPNNQFILGDSSMKTVIDGQTVSIGGTVWMVETITGGCSPTALGSGSANWGVLNGYLATATVADQRIQVIGNGGFLTNFCFMRTNAPGAGTNIVVTLQTNSSAYGASAISTLVSSPMTVTMFGNFANHITNTTTTSISLTNGNRTNYITVNLNPNTALAAHPYTWSVQYWRPLGQ